MKITRLVSPLAAMAWVLAMSAGAAGAQQAPAENPPEGYSGTQFIDSEGCVFLRAAIGERVKWVPQVNRERRLVCGGQPTFAQPQSAASVQASKLRVAKPAPSAQVMAFTAPASQGSAEQITNGTWTSGVVVTPANAASKGVSDKARVLPRHVYEDRKSMRPVKTPQNFVPAWKDDRLNPRRAEQTLQGHAQMQKVWTNTVPRRLVD